ncbi:hypothetical protein DFH06DRAFT_1243460 [Mycena polygramma]|nr:hypothetical protein DFH06DRAFT_1243460 [Mycena polygramma]
MSIPPELILRILELSLSSESYDIRRYCKPEREYEHLRTTALVCKRWTAPSEMLLWRYVSLTSPLHVERWLNSTAAGRYTTLGLRINGRGLWEARLRLVLGRTVGLETPDLVFCAVSATCLSLPELKDLNALVLSNSSVSPDSESDFPFRLRFFQTMHTYIHPEVMEQLFRKSANTLECLELEQQHAIDSPTLIGLYGYFPLVAANIRILRITNAYSCLVPFFASCTALRRLELTFEVTPQLATAIFKVLPTFLEDLYVEAGYFSGGQLLLSDVVRGLDYPSLSHLQRLHLQQDVIDDSANDRFHGLDELVELEALRAKLKARDITVLAISER